MSNESAGFGTRPRGAKRERTKARLIEVAYELFQKRGIQTVSLEEVAASAGLTRGSIYGNFKDKDDLVFHVMTAKMLGTGPVLRGKRSLEEQLELVAGAFAALTPAALAQLRMMAEFQAYALAHKAIRSRAAALARKNVSRAAAELRESVKLSQLPLPPEKFVIVVNALFAGLLYYRALMPDLVDDRLAARALQAILPRKQGRGSRRQQ